MNFKQIIICIISSLLVFACAAKLELPQYIDALNAYNEGKYQTTLTLINQAISIEPDVPEYFVLRAKANYKLNYKASAMSDLNSALKLEESFSAFYLKGRIFLERSEFSKAKVNFRKSYKLNPTSPELLFDLGYLEYLNGENQLAIDYYLKAAKYDSRNPAVYVNIGNLYAIMGNSKLAIDNYSKALVLDTTDGIPYYNRANEKMILNDITGAIEDYKKSLEIDSLNANTMFILAEAQSKIGDYSGAIVSYNSILKIDSTSAKGFYLRGLSLLSLNDEKNACTDFNKAGELGYFDAYEMIKKYCDPKKLKQTKKSNKNTKR
ncbi:MAG: tetratricopeptide repeat protein [Ignavibacterium sp.]|jgi:tetratricopeptide (TPR) repeat protein|nr:tetratricopeptide repeat protein [Ignavibacterium sp.]MDX9713478.1 tetratricopeptide repeat protein [Ignavibacteriaceae bacterium]MEB2354390.1 tetratricopeptide repeat protein [Ignavibacteriales bacterium]